MITVFGSVFQTVGAEHRKACFANVIVSQQRTADTSCCIQWVTGFVANSKYKIQARLNSTTFQGFSSTFKHPICFQALSMALKFLFQIQAFSRISQARYEPWSEWVGWQTDCCRESCSAAVAVTSADTSTPTVCRRRHPVPPRSQHRHCRCLSSLCHCHHCQRDKSAGDAHTAPPAWQHQRIGCSPRMNRTFSIWKGSPHPKRQPDRFIRFRTDHGCDQTDGQCYSSNNRPHQMLCIATHTHTHSFNGPLSICRVSTNTA